MKAAAILKELKSPNLQIVIGFIDSLKEEIGKEEFGRLTREIEIEKS